MGKSRMKKTDFDMILERAVNGSRSDIEQILKLYEPLINKASYIKGKIDEDLKQYIWVHLDIATRQRVNHE